MSDTSGKYIVTTRDLANEIPEAVKFKHKNKCDFWSFFSKIFHGCVGDSNVLHENLRNITAVIGSIHLWP